MSGFVDEVTIEFCAGSGGDGCASFFKQKGKPKGPADGGDGGNGGSIILEATDSLSTLAPLRYQHTISAFDGARGGNNQKTGGGADDVVISVPVGTLAFEAEVLLADLAVLGARYTIAQGGVGGKGNSAIATSVERFPSFADRGEPGEQREVKLELRIVADVGLIGLPNAGKSSLLKSTTAATPKTADYPFTTLEPNLGVAYHDENRIVIADLPGLIEGASEGKGLGIRFLRHVRRCAVLVAVVDSASPDPIADLKTVLAELDTFDEELSSRVSVLVANKLDIGDPSALRDYACAHGMAFFGTEAVYDIGTSELSDFLFEIVLKARSETSAETYARFRPAQHDPVLVSKEPDWWIVSSGRVERVVSMTPMMNPRAVRHMQRRLGALGVYRELISAGAVRGDEVHIGEMSFEFQPDE